MANQHDQPRKNHTMTVKLAPALPKDDKNGLDAISLDLIDRYRSKEHTVAIVVLKTAEINQDEDFQHIPKVRIVRVEPIIDEDDETAALDLLQAATEQRVGRKPDTLNFAPETEFEDVAPLELEAGIEDAEIVEEDDEPAPVMPLAPTSLFGGDAA